MVGVVGGRRQRDRKMRRRKPATEAGTSVCLQVCDSHRAPDLPRVYNSASSAVPQPSTKAQVQLSFASPSITSELSAQQLLFQEAFQEVLRGRVPLRQPQSHGGCKCTPCLQ